LTAGDNRFVLRPSIDHLEPIVGASPTRFFADLEFIEALKNENPFSHLDVKADAFITSGRL
jgi:hypothetical protein